LRRGGEQGAPRAIHCAILRGTARPFQSFFGPIARGNLVTQARLVRQRTFWSGLPGFVAWPSPTERGPCV
jgi:hypothetical protein